MALGIAGIRWAKSARHPHLKNCFAGTAAEEHNGPSMFSRNAMGQSKPQPGSLLFTFAHEWLKQALANLLRDSGAVVHHVHHNRVLMGFQSNDYFPVGSDTP